MNWAGQTDREGWSGRRLRGRERWGELGVGGVPMEWAGEGGQRGMGVVSRRPKWAGLEYETWYYTRDRMCRLTLGIIKCSMAYYRGREGKTESMDNEWM